MYGFAAAADARADDRIYNCLPMYHSNGGVIAVGIALTAGGSCYIRERFSASEFWSDTIRRDCTMFIYVANCADTSTMRRRRPGSRPSPAHGGRQRSQAGHFRPVPVALRHPQILEFYAATEGNVALFNFDSHPGAVGRLPFWAARRFPIRTVAFDVDAGVEKRDGAGHCLECGVDEPGELLGEISDDPGKPAAKFDGYCDPTATRAKILRDVFKPGDAWFRTGDLLKRDARGYYYFVDRIGDTFRWKGENVSTTEVAETISAYPGVLEATVYGVALPGHDGRAGMAAVVSTTSPNSISPDCASNSPSACPPMRGRCSCVSGRSSTSPAPSSRARSSSLRRASIRTLRRSRLFRRPSRRGYVRVDADFVDAAGAGAIPL